MPGSLAAVLAILRGRSFGAPMRSGILGAFPRARSAEWPSAGRGPFIWDSNAVLTHHAKILPRKQGLATLKSGWCGAFIAGPL
jgi:hypothetical protein